MKVISMKVVYILVGGVAPVACFAFDTLVFTADGYLGRARVFAYLVAGLCVALFVGQKWVKPLAPRAWVWAPCFMVVGAVALAVAVMVIPITLVGCLYAGFTLLFYTRGDLIPGSLRSLLEQVFVLFASAVGLMAWAPALLYLYTGLRGVRETFMSVRRLLAALAFGLAALGGPALLNAAWLGFTGGRRP